MKCNAENVHFSGYGHLVPKTLGGRQFTIVYAMVGIPIFVVMLAGLGNKLSSKAQKVIENYNFGREHSILARLIKSLAIIIFGNIILVIIPAHQFSIMEGWTYTEALYYVFVSLTTVGFGDYVAGKTLLYW